MLFFPATYQQCASHPLVEDAVVAVQGRLDSARDQPELIAMEITVPTAREGPRGPARS